jgi:hypothetical protein
MERYMQRLNLRDTLNIKKMANVFRSKILGFGAICILFTVGLEPLQATAQPKPPKKIDFVVKLGNFVAGCTYTYRLNFHGKSIFLTLRNVDCGVGPGDKQRISENEGLVFPLNSNNMEEHTCVLTRTTESCSDGSKRFNRYHWLKNGEIRKNIVNSSRYTKAAISLVSQTKIKHSKAWRNAKPARLDILINITLNGSACTVTRFTEDYHGGQTNEKFKKQISCSVTR